MGIMDVSLTVSQVSRVAVIGANGAGKSTAIKVLVGEQKPTMGSIWKASGLRMVYRYDHWRCATLLHPPGGREESEDRRSCCSNSRCCPEPPSKEEGEDIRVRGEVADE